MKKSFILFMAVVAIAVVACKPNQAKQASKYVKKAVQEYRAVSRSEGTRYARFHYRYQQIANTHECWRCKGYGELIVTDSYGNVVFNYDGSPATVTCDVCDGKGYTR